MQRNYWYSAARSTRLLEEPVAIGQEAARRTLQRLGARQAKTQQAPVVFSPEVARSIVGNIFDAANGDAIYRHASFFAGMLGERVAGENVTVIDDGTLVFDRVSACEGGISGSMKSGGFGTAPFDGEGLPTRRTVLIENGILKSYVTNTYTARKLGLTSSTGNASRSLAGNPGIGAGNFFLQPGKLTPEQIIADVPNGLYVTETMGFGINLVTGDYSQGAAGMWIENGELAYPVEEITIAGNLKEMYKNISAIGNDLVFRTATAAPTLRIEGMTIAGS
jgi:PmbA protein